MVERLAERLGRAVVLYDAGFGLVAFSAQGEEADDARRSIVLARNASDAARTLIRGSGAGREHGPVRIPAYAPTGARGRVVFAVRHQDRVQGYLTYIDDAPADTAVPAGDAEVLGRVEDELGRLLVRRRLRERRARTRAGRLLRDLLSDEPGRHQAAEALLDEGLVAPAAAYTAAVVRQGLGPAQHRLRSAEVRLAIEESLNGLTAFAPQPPPWTMRGDHGVLVLALRAPPDRADPTSARMLDTLVGLVRPYDLVIGTGDPRARLGQLRDGYREAVAAAEVARRSPSGRGLMVAWSQTGVDRLLVRLPLDQLTTVDLPPAVQSLLAEDGGLATTLEAYLDHACDAQATARTLMIHRSTLYYRLGRVKEITGADLSDGPTRLELHLGLKVAGLIP